MAYTATNWIEGVTTLGPTNMNKIETELVFLDTATSKAPGTELAYAEQTAASITISGGSEAVANNLAQTGSVSYDGTPVMIEFFATYIANPSAAAGTVSFWLYQDSTSLGAIGALVLNPAGGIALPVLLSQRITPPAGSHVYGVRGSVSTGTGTMVSGPGGTGQQRPAYIRVTRV